MCKIEEPIARQVEICRWLGGIPWAEGRRIVDLFRVRVWEGGPRRWSISRDDWNAIKAAIHSVSDKAVAS